jgi:hypothetical protein
MSALFTHNEGNPPGFLHPRSSYRHRLHPTEAILRFQHNRSSYHYTTQSTVWKTPAKVILRLQHQRSSYHHSNKSPSICCLWIHRHPSRCFSPAISRSQPRYQQATTSASANQSFKTGHGLPATNTARAAHYGAVSNRP